MNPQIKEGTVYFKKDKDFYSRVHTTPKCKFLEGKDITESRYYLVTPAQNKTYFVTLENGDNELVCQYCVPLMDYK